MTKALAAEVASRSITVNCVAPGFIETPMTDALNEKQREAILATHSDGAPRHGARNRRRGRSISPRAEAAYVTGQTLHVNGGMAMIQRVSGYWPERSVAVRRPLARATRLC